jgi:type IV pilus assembly protein PilZ
MLDGRPRCAHPGRFVAAMTAPTLEPSAEEKRKAEDDKREAERAAITLKVDYKRLNTFFADYTKNISKGGTFIRTAKPLPVGTEFLFVLSLPTLNEQVQLTGEVKWVVLEEGSSDDKPPGMGIKFKFESDADRSRVDQFVERLMKTALGSHISDKLLTRT